MANVENILKVAEAIERRSVPGLGFNMGWLTLQSSTMPLLGIDHLHVENCGTVACIAGWANALAGSLEEPTFKVAKDFLGLDGAQHSQLFYASNHPDKTERDDTGPLDTIDPVQAVRTLRRFASTGLVDWAA